MAGCEIFKASLGCLEFQMNLRRDRCSKSSLEVHHDTVTSEGNNTLHYEKCTTDRIWLILLFICVKEGGWVISKSTEIFEELELRLDH